MIRLLTALLTVALVSTFGSVRAEDKKEAKGDKAKPTGVWAKEIDGMKLTFDFSKPDALILTAGSGDNALILTGKYTVEKDGLIKVTTTKSEIKGEFPVQPKEGFLFEFKLKTDGKTATISNYDASEDADGARAAVEGEYTKAEPKKKDDK